MIPIPILPPFQARWEAPLKPSPSCSWQRLAQIFFFPVAAIVRRILLPSAWLKETDKQQACTHFEKLVNRLQQRFPITCSKIPITTPDRAKIQAILFRTFPLEANRSTIICFNPNAAIAEQLPFPHLLREALRRGAPCNFVFFNYRNAEKFNTVNDLVIDGASVVQWVKEILRTPNDQIHFIGRSLGAIVETQVKALNPESTPGRLVNDRSGSSMDDFIDSIASTRLKILGIFKHILRLIGLSFDAVTPFRKLVGRNMVIHHAQDRIFPPSRNLAHRILDIEHEKVELISNENLDEDPHNFDLRDCLDSETQRPATERIYNFLFGPPIN